MPLSRRLICLSLSAVLAGVGTTAWEAEARDKAKQDERPRQHDRASDQRALSDAVRRAERATRGQVLSAERVQYDGRELNRVKVVDDRGRVRVYWDDPQAAEAEPEEEDAPRSRRTRDDDGDSD